MTGFTIHHQTTFRYGKPVQFGPHRMMMRPRDSHDQRHIDHTLTVTPPPASLRSSQDVFGNAITTATFQGRAKALTITSTLRIDHTPIAFDPVDVELYARLVPFGYDPLEMPDLQRSTERYYPDPAHATAGWARGLLRTDGPTSTHALLTELTHRIHRQYTYVGRQEAGIQAPHETLRLGTGTCRDFAVLMMEAARCLGFAARFVTGYIHVARKEATKTLGGGNTHAWVQIYVPGPGWVDFDPTNNIVGSRDLIRVASVREPGQAVPLSGSWSGNAEDCLGMDVTVDVVADPSVAAQELREMPKIAAR